MTHGFENRHPYEPGRVLYHLIEQVMQERFGRYGRSPMIPWERLDNGVPHDYPHEKDAWREIARCFEEYLEPDKVPF